MYKDHLFYKKVATALTAAQAQHVMCTLQICKKVAASMQTHLEPVPLAYSEPLGKGKHSL